MALTVAIEGYGEVTNAENTTGWSKTGLISNPVQEGDNYLQGSYCVSSKASAKAGALVYDIGSGNELDFSGGGAEEGELVYIWVNVTTLGGLNTIANGGLRITLMTDTSNYAEWYVIGSDTLDRWRGGKGGFICLAVDPTTTPTATTGTFNLASVRYFGMYIDNTGSAKSENLLIDTIAVGKGIRLTGTDTNGWEDVVSYCTAYATRAWGMVQEDETGAFVFVQGKIFIGDSTQTANTSLTTEEGRIFKWYSYEYYRNGDWYPLIPDDYHGVTIEDAASYTTTYEDGALVGSDQGRSGSTFIGAGYPLGDTTFDLYGGSNASSLTKLYGVSFLDIDGGISMGNDAQHLVYSCVFNGCGIFDPVGAPVVRNCQFVGTATMRDQDLASGLSYANGTTTYTDQTSGANNSTADDMTLVQSTPAVGDAFYFGSEDQFDFVDVDVSTVGATFVVTWEYWNGSTWTNLATAHNLIDGTNSYRNSGVNRVRWDWPSDWARTNVSGTGLTGQVGPYYWVRARVTTGGGTQALGQQAWMGTRYSGAAVKWNASADVRDCQFIANAHDYNDPAGVEHPSAGDSDYYGMVFSGNDYDVLNSAAATTVDSYSETNRDGDQPLGNGTIIGVGQSFTATATVLSNVRFYLSKTGSPTGNIVCKLYAHTGTFGTDGTPTGAALATSENVSAASLLTVPGLVQFEFKDEYTMSAGYYFVALEYSGGDVSNYVNVGRDGSTPGHGGNIATLTGVTWTGSSSYDACFYVSQGGIVGIGNQPGSDAVTSVERGSPPGATIMESLINLKITVKDEAGDPVQNAQTAIYKDSDGGQLMNEDTTSLGVAEESYNYPGSPVPVSVRVRKASSGDEKYEAVNSPQTIGASGLDITITLREDPNL